MTKGFALNHDKSLQMYFFYVKCQPKKNDFLKDVLSTVGLFQYFFFPLPKGYIVFVCSVSPFICPSMRPVVIPSINLFYNQVLLWSFLIIYNSAATDQKLFIFGMGVPGRVLFHSASMDPWVMPQGRQEVKI